MRPQRRTHLRRLLSALALTLIASAACSGSTAPEPTWIDDCIFLCQSYSNLPCKYDSHAHRDNLVTSLVEEHPFTCKTRCELQYTQYVPEEACAAAVFELHACAARQGFQCAPGALAAIDGCDAPARLAATRCEICLLMLSSGSCPPSKPSRWYCATPDASRSSGGAPLCHPECVELAPSEYCCPDAFWEGPCDPARAEACANDC